MSEIASSTWFTTAPHWGWLIVFYYLFGGLAAGSYFIAALIDLIGRSEDRPIARMGYFVAIPCLMVSGVLLLLDLYRPDRFWHLFLQSNTMRPIFEYWAPMSIGSWAIMIFSLFAFLSFLGALGESRHRSWEWAGQLRPPSIVGRVIVVLGMLMAMYVAGYAGVLLAVTNRPLWSDTPLLGMLLGVSAMSISASLLLLIARWRGLTFPGVRSLDRFDSWVIGLTLLVLVAVIVSLGSVARVWLSLWGVLLLVAVLVGMIVPLFMRWRSARSAQTSALAAVMVLIGGFILRTVIVFTQQGIQP